MNLHETRNLWHRFCSNSKDYYASHFSTFIKFKIFMAIFNFEQFWTKIFLLLPFLRDWRFSLCIRAHICRHTCTHANTHTDMNRYTHMCVSIYEHTRSCTFLRAHSVVHSQIHTRTHAHVCTDAHTHAHNKNHAHVRTYK